MNRLFPKQYLLYFSTYLLSLCFFNFANGELDSNLEARIDEWIARMTLEEKVAMCHAQSKFSSPGVSRLGLPEVWMSDGPHGVRAEFQWDSWSKAEWTNDACTAFPALTCLAASFNPTLAYEYGVALGEEARYREKDVILGPGVNIYRTPLNGRNFEYLGEDPLLASQLAVPYIRGVQSNGVAACVKHFALNNQEKWRHEINVEVSDRALYEIYLPAFEAAVKEAGVWSLMGAYNLYQGQQCCHNERLLNQILKGDWEFDGVVISDWGGTEDTWQAAHYGLDIEMGTHTDGLSASKKSAYDQYYLADPFLQKIRDGEISEAVVDDKVRRIVRLMYRTMMNPERPLGRMMSEAHSATARLVAQEGIVLLKNENSFFPLQSAQEVVIAVIGENATRSMTVGGGSSELKAAYEISPLQGIRERFPNADIRYAMGYGSGKSIYGEVDPSPYDAENLRAEALHLASEADIVLFVGGLNKNNLQDCEGADRVEYGLPFGQEQLIQSIAEVNPNMGVLLVSGNAVGMPWADDVEAIAQVWYLGSEAGHAIADVISGDVNPSGKLPFSIPVNLEDCGAHAFGKNTYPGDGSNVSYDEGIFVGYRWHQSKKMRPRYAFGCGLSYTLFELGKLKTDSHQYTSDDSILVTFEVKNSGLYDGAEVAQLYVGKQNSMIDRAPMELKAFQKVKVAKGEQVEVELKIPVSKLAYYDESQSDWIVESGIYQLKLANASDSVFESVDIEILK